MSTAHNRRIIEEGRKQFNKTTQTLLSTLKILRQIKDYTLVLVMEIFIFYLFTNLFADKLYNQ